MARTATVAAAALLGALSVTGCTSVTEAVPLHTGTAVAATAGAAAVSPSKAVKALAALVTRPGYGASGYTRSAFGASWADVDKNSCDTRNDILTRDLRNRTYRPGGCLVASGILADPYTGRTIRFVRGNTTSTAVQIDHVVALSDAWKSGANTWTSSQRLAFANDRGELLAVDGPANQAKGASNAASWLPANVSYRCAYVARQVAVKTKYRLTVTAAEKRAIGTVLVKCPTQGLPSV